MRRGPLTRILQALIIAATAAAPSASALAAFDPAYNPHAHFRSEGMCPKCHVGAAGPPAGGRISGASTAFCLGCHTGEALGRSHPIGIRPRGREGATRIPADLLLDDAGRIMCLTCHDAHGPFVATVKAFASQEPENSGRARGAPAYYRTRYLRRSDPVKGFAVLCNRCHVNL